jgi:hypothetical protein
LSFSQFIGPSKPVISISQLRLAFIGPEVRMLLDACSDGS